MNFITEHIVEFIIGSGGVCSSILTYILGKREKAANAESIEIANLKEVIDQLKEQVKWLNEQLTDARQQIDNLTEELKKFKSNINNESN